MELHCSDTYAAPISTVFKTTGVNPSRSVHPFASPKKLPPAAVFWVGCLLPAYSSNSTILCLLCASVDGRWFGHYDPI